MSPETELGQDRASLAGLLRGLSIWLDANPGDAGWLGALRFGVAGGFAAAGDPDLAEAEFRKILDQDPDHPWSWIGLIDIALLRGDVGAAVAMGQAALQQMPYHAALRRKTAEAVEQAQGPDAALTVMGGVPDLAHVALEDLAYMIGLYRAAGRVTGAAGLCDRLLAARPDDAQARLARIEIAFANDDGPGAVTAAAQALHHHPSDPEIIERAAQAHVLSGDVLGRGAGDAPVAPVADPLALFDDVETAILQGGAAVERAVGRVLACPDLPWYLALRLVERVWSMGALALAGRLSAWFDAAPWPPVDHAAFAIEDTLLRHGPRAALDRVRAHPVARRDPEAAERLARVLLAAGAGPVAARYARACHRRWPGDAVFARYTVDAMGACGAVGRVQAMTLGPPPAPLTDQIERAILAGDLGAAETCLAKIDAGDGPLQEALIYRPRATRLGSLLQEARILSAAGIDWAGADPKDLAAPAEDFFLAAQSIVQRMPARAPAPAPARAGTGHGATETIQLYLPYAHALSQEVHRTLDALRGATRRKLILRAEQDAQDWLQGHIGADAAHAFGMATDPDQKADLMRLATLWGEGGVAMTPLQWPSGDLDALFDNITGAGFFIDDGGAVSSDVVIAPPGHPVIGWALDRAVAACLSRETEHRWFKTGPGVLTRAVAAALPTADVTLFPLTRLRRLLHPHRPFATPDGRAPQPDFIAALAAIVGGGDP